MCRTSFEAGRATGENDRALRIPVEEGADCPRCWKNTPEELNWIAGYESGRWVKAA